MKVLAIFGNVIFVSTWCVGIAGWFLGLYETISAWRLTGALFRIGYVVFTENKEVPDTLLSLPQNQIIKLEDSQLKLIDAQTLIFSSRLRFVFFRPHLQTPIKGMISWNSPYASIVVRIPIGLVLFFAAWFIGWTIGGVVTGLSPDSGLLEALVFLLFGWLIAGTICFLMVRGGRQEAEKTVAQVLHYLSLEK